MSHCSSCFGVVKGKEKGVGERDLLIGVGALCGLGRVEAVVGGVGVGPLCQRGVL